MNIRENYWLEKLDNVEGISLPTISLEDNATTNFSEIAIPAESIKVIQELAKNSDLNIFKLFLCGLAIVVKKYCSQDRFLVATPPLLDKRKGKVKTGTLFCDLQLDRGLKVQELLVQIHEVLNEAHLNSSYDEALFRKLFANQHQGKTSILDTIGFGYDKITDDSSRLKDCVLIFELIHKGDWKLTVTSQKQRFPKTMLEGMLKSLLFVVSELSLLKNKTIEQCPILPNESIQEWTKKFESNKRAYPKDTTVIDLFIEQVQQNGDNIAINFDGKQITYQELNNLSNDVASYLIHNAGHEPIKYVGMMMDKSIHMVATMIGIMKCGAAYVPIDEGYPDARIENMLQETACQVVFVDKDITNPNEQQYKYVNALTLSSHNLKSDYSITRPNDPAYVIYSSGTTGVPKGIVIQHHAIINLIYWYKERYNMNPETRIVQVTKIVVDIAFQEIFSALTQGLTLYVPTTAEHQDKELFIDFLDRNKINFIQLIPNTLSEYFADIPKLKHLDIILCGGDKLSEQLKDTIVSKGYQLYNIYGQTETSIDAVGAICKEGTPMNFSDYVANYDVWILDENNQLSPEYVTGQIGIGGKGVGLGYINQSELTRKKFIDHPYHKGEKMYLTGDLGRRLSDGSIEFIGREDNQIKILGFRIELGEIENMLEKHPKINAATLIANQFNEESKELIAFYTSDNAIDHKEIRSYLESKLPMYMIPSKYYKLDSIPLTNTGKIDKKKLLELAKQYKNDTLDYVAPSNEIELRLTEIWEGILEKTKISVEDNFFRLGGHSLKAMRLVSKIRKEFNVEITLAQIFEKPSIAGIAAFIAKAVINVGQEIKPAAHKDTYPLSTSQKRMWVISQYDASNKAYNICEAFWLNEQIKPELLQQAALDVISRHEILRTRFNDNQQGEVTQSIIPVSEFDFTIGFKDLRKHEDRNQLVKEAVQNDFEQMFDIKQGPLLRLNLYQTEEKKFVVCCVIHHIISDGWSLEIFFNELIKLYLAYVQEKPISLPELKLQYKDYADWEQSYIKSKAFSAHQNFWLEQLEGEIPMIDLPTTNKRPAIKSFRGGYANMAIEKETLIGLKTLINDDNSSLFIGLLTIVKILIYRYSEQEDIIIGTPVAERPHSDLENQIGLYLNTIPLRTHLDEQDDFKKLLRKIKGVTLNAFEHRMYPLDSIIDDLKIPRDVSRNPLFDIVVVLQNTEIEGFESNHEVLGIEKYYNSKHTTSKFDLVFNFKEHQDHLELGLEYNKDIFDEDMAIQLSCHFKQLLQCIVATPNKLLQEYQFLNDEEKQHIIGLNEFRNISFPKQETIVSAFEKQVALYPEKVALTYNGISYSYQELNAITNQLGNYLQKKYNITSNDLVGVKLDRSEWMVITLLGVLKSGGAYVPFDPNYPQERIDFMIQDSQCKLMIDDRELHDFITTKDEYSNASSAQIAKPNNLAYVIYTSGTTGTPKGALVTHENVVRLFKTDMPLFDFDHTDTWTVFHSYCFDFSVWEMYGALLFGGKLVVVPKVATKDPSLYYQLLCDEQVTVLNQTPSVFNTFSNLFLENRTNELNLRYVIFGGEALKTGSLKKWKQKFPDTKLINMYGITETTVHVTYREITDEDITHGNSPIGKPIPTLSCYVLDQKQNIVPIGGVGELFVGGKGVTRGYLNRPELTAIKFVEDPFKQGETLYRTGDKVKLNKNGELEYLGRIDEQVKIRGFRIELGEIENVLSSLEGIDQACAVVVEDKGSKKIIAYVSGARSKDTFGIKDVLGKKMPFYMLPDVIVSVPEFPLTVNGKINKKKLPKPDIASQIESNYEAPINEIQETIVAIWEDVLGIDRIGINDNFFSIGGNSIAAIEIISAMARKGWKISVRDIFESPTIAELSEVATPVVQNAIDQNEVVGKMNLLPIQNWYLETQQEDVSHFNYATTFQVPKHFTEEHLFEMSRLLMQRHDALRLKFEDTDDATYQSFSEELLHKVTEVRAIDHENPEEQRTQLKEAISMAQTSLSIKDGILFKMIWYQCGEQYSSIVFSIHHLVVDGISWRILLSDIEFMIEKISKSEVFKLEPKTNSYKEWSEALEDYASSDRLFQQRKYWVNTLNSVNDKFKTDLNIQSRKSIDQIDYFLELSETETTQLIKESSTAFQTEINDLLLSALTIAICDWNGIDNFLIHLEGHGRENLEHALDISQTVGWFTTVFPVALSKKGVDVSEKSNIGFIIRDIKENLHKIPDKGIGYGVLRHLVKDLALMRSEERSEVPVLFNFLGEFKQKGIIGQDSDAGLINNTRSEKHVALYPLEFNGAIYNGQLNFCISYIKNEFDTSSIELLADTFKSALKDIITHCLSIDHVRHTPSDFPLADISSESIKELEDNFGELVDIFPATSMQKGMYFYSLANEGTGGYVVQQHGILKNIDPEKFESSWKSLLQRYDVLRSLFMLSEDSGLLQVVLKNCDLNFQLIDLTQIDPDAQQHQIKDIIEQDAKEDFDFEAGSLIRIKLIQRAKDDYYVILSFHHIILDGWSFPILYTELYQIYSGRQSTLDRTIPYSNYIKWLNNQDGEKAYSFWKNVLVGIETPTVLSGLDNLNYKKGDVSGHKEVFKELSLSDSQSIRNKAIENNVTLNVLFVAAWGMLLKEYTATKKVLFGMTLSGRSNSFQGIENMVGLFINTAPIVLEFDEHISFGDWLKVIQKNQLDIDQYSHIGISEIQKCSAIDQEHPLFDSLLVHENYPNLKYDDDHKDTPVFSFDNVGNKDNNNHPITLMIFSENNISFIINYDQEIFSQFFIEQLIIDFVRILEKITSIDSNAKLLSFEPSVNLN